MYRLSILKFKLQSYIYSVLVKFLDWRISASKRAEQKRMRENNE